MDFWILPFFKVIAASLGRGNATWRVFKRMAAPLDSTDLLLPKQIVVESGSAS
jgi:hypothetical protein